MKKSLRRLLRRLAKKRTPIEGALRRLEEGGHDFDEKEIRKYYKRKLKASKGSRKRCKHVFLSKLDEDGDEIWNEDIQERELHPCKYCGMTWAEVKEKRASAESKPKKKKKKKKKKKRRKKDK